MRTGSKATLANRSELDVVLADLVALAKRDANVGADLSDEGGVLGFVEALQLAAHADFARKRSSRDLSNI